MPVFIYIHVHVLVNAHIPLSDHVCMHVNIPLHACIWFTLNTFEFLLCKVDSVIYIYIHIYIELHIKRFHSVLHHCIYSILSLTPITQYRVYFIKRYYHCNWTDRYIRSRCVLHVMGRNRQIYDVTRVLRHSYMGQG